MAGTASLLVGLGDLYPACETEFTPEIMLAANIATNHFTIDTAKNIEALRREIIVAMADIFEQVDFIICATNPDVAFGAQGPMPTTIDGRRPDHRARLRGGARQQRRVDDPGQHDGSPRRRDPGGIGRRAPRLHADDRAPALRAAAARPGPGRRAGAAVAAGGSDSASLKVADRRRYKPSWVLPTHSAAATGRREKFQRLLTSRRIKQHAKSERRSAQIRFWRHSRWVALATAREGPWRKISSSLLPGPSRCRHRWSRSRKRAWRSAPICRSGCSRTPRSSARPSRSSPSTPSGTGATPGPQHDRMSVARARSDGRLMIAELKYGKNPDVDVAAIKCAAMASRVLAGLVGRALRPLPQPATRP